MDKDKIAIIQRQTTYTEEEARERLQEKGDYIKVIEEFMGIKKDDNKKNHSLQQEIYRQIRAKMDIKQYNNKQYEKIENDLQQQR